MTGLDFNAVPAFGLEVLRSASQAASQAAEAAAVEEICKEGAPNDGLEPTANGPGPHRYSGLPIPVKCCLGRTTKVFQTDLAIWTQKSLCRHRKK